MVTKLRASGYAFGAAALVGILWSVLPVWRVWDFEIFSEHWSFGTLWRAGRHFPDNYRDADSTTELLTLHWWNAVLALPLLATSALVGRHVFRVCRRRPDEPTRLGWGLNRLATLRRQGALLARGRMRRTRSRAARRQSPATRQLRMRTGRCRKRSGASFSGCWGTALTARRATCVSLTGPAWPPCARVGVRP